MYFIFHRKYRTRCKYHCCTRPLCRLSMFFHVFLSCFRHPLCQKRLALPACHLASYTCDQKLQFPLHHSLHDVDACVRSFWISIFLILCCYLFFFRTHFISKARTRFMSFYLNVHVSAAYTRTLVTHTDSNLVSVWMMISLLNHAA